MKYKLLLLLFLATTLSLSAQKGYEKSICLDGNIGFGNELQNGINLSMINGYRFSGLYIGVGVGVGLSDHTAYCDVVKGENEFKSETDFIIPVYGQIKYNFTKGKVSPFINLNVGQTFDFSDVSDFGFFMTPSLGVDFSNFYIMAGLNIQSSRYDYNYYGGVGDYESKFTSLNIGLGIKF